MEIKLESIKRYCREIDEPENRALYYWHIIKDISKYLDKPFEKIKKKEISIYLNHLIGNNNDNVYEIAGILRMFFKEISNISFSQKEKMEKSLKIRSQFDHKTFLKTPFL